MKFQDLTGNVYNYFTVEEYVGRSRWLCKCKCGNYRTILASNLKSGKYKSCGCIRNNTTYDLSGEYGIGKDVKGKEFYFDLEDYDKIKNIIWNVTSSGYVQGKINRKTVRLNRYILDITDKKILIDHINHKVFDNRKDNLRISNNSTNQYNRIKAINNFSGTTGVHWNKQNKRWKACIGFDYQNKYLGSFLTLEEAVQTRKEAEEKYFGEFSYDNSIATLKEEEEI